MFFSPCESRECDLCYYTVISYPGGLQLHPKHLQLISQSVVNYSLVRATPLGSSPSKLRRHGVNQNHTKDWSGIIHIGRRDGQVIWKGI